MPFLGVFVEAVAVESCAVVKGPVSSEPSFRAFVNDMRAICRGKHALHPMM